MPAREIITPAVFDYNNDGVTDLCVLVQPPSDPPKSRAKTSQPSADNHFDLWFSPVSSQYTVPDAVIYFDVDYPITGDFDGDGIGDIAGSKNVNGNRLWRIRKSTGGGIIEETFGLSSDLPVPGDYDGDGKTDIAVFRNGVWYIKRSSDNEVINYFFGLSTDIPLTLPNSSIYY